MKTLPPNQCFVCSTSHYRQSADGAARVSKCRECGLWQDWTGPRLHGCRACMFKDFGTREQPAWVIKVQVGTRFFGLLPRYEWTFKVRT